YRGSTKLATIDPPADGFQFFGGGGLDSVSITAGGDADVFEIYPDHVLWNGTIVESDALVLWQLNGGSGDDTFIDRGGFASINGAGGSDTLQAADQANGWA